MTNPSHQMPYWQGRTMREKTAEAARDQIENGVIQSAASKWTSPVVLVLNSAGSLWFFVNYKILNEAKVAEKYPLPRMEDCIYILEDAVVFYTFYSNCSYWKILISAGGRDKTRFTTNKCTYLYTRMAFGLRNAPKTFERALDIILFRIRWKLCLV